MDKKGISPLVHPAEVRALMNDPNVVIVDARGGPDALLRYRKGHLEGAIFLDLETDLSEKGPDAARGGRHPLPDPKQFGVTLGEAGISASSFIVVYDDKAGANAAARFWWMMRAAGHTRVQVVDGGLAALQAEGLPLATSDAVPQAAAKPYPVTGWGLPLADIQDIEHARNQKGHVIVDAREGYRYRGESEPIDLIAGHIPGAINIPYLDNLADNGRFREPEEIAAHYRNLIGNRTQEEVIVHCGSGVTACHTLLAMAHAGLEIPGLYVGSWSEWSRNQKPVARGEKP